MATTVIEEERIRYRRVGDPADGDVVVYWMQQAQRARGNDALEYAIQRANDLDRPLAVAFCATGEYPDAAARHYHFMIEGLQDVESTLRRRSISFTAFAAEAPSVFAALDHRLCLLVVDRGYLPIQERWRRDVEKATSCPMVEVETDVVVPIGIVSEHVETAARTIRPKIEAELDRFVVERSTAALRHESIGGSGPDVVLERTKGAPPTLDVHDLDGALRALEVDDAIGPVDGWTGGHSAASAKLRSFCESVLPDYSNRRQRFDRDDSCSMLSPHLHFGQISPVDVAPGERCSDNRGGGIHRRGGRPA